MTDHDPVIRAAFQDDASSMARADQDRLWTALHRRQTRQVRRRYFAGAGVVLLAGAAVGGVIAIRNLSRSSASAGALDALAVAADSLPNSSPAEPPMIQEQSGPDVIPLLGHRSGLQMDLARYEAQIDALSRRLTTTNGAEHDVVERQLASAENQLQSTKAALAVVDRELSGNQGPATAYSSIAVSQGPPIVFGGPSAMPDEVMLMAGGLGGGLLLVSLTLLVYMRRIVRTTRESLAQVESQISSQHATLASGIDAIALEVERLGEGQRFMSRVLSKGEPQRAGEAPA